MNNLQEHIYQLVVSYFSYNAWDEPVDVDEWFYRHANDLAAFMRENYDEELLHQAWHAAEHLRGER